MNEWSSENRPFTYVWEGQLHKQVRSGKCGSLRSPNLWEYLFRSEAELNIVFKSDLQASSLVTDGSIRIRATWIRLSAYWISCRAFTNKIHNHGESLPLRYVSSRFLEVYDYEAAPLYNQGQNHSGWQLRTGDQAKRNSRLQHHGSLNFKKRLCLHRVPTYRYVHINFQLQRRSWGRDSKRWTTSKLPNHDQ